MRIEQIGQILEIVECGSIGKAAQKLYMQQPNLSMAVKAVEEEFKKAIDRAENIGMSKEEILEAVKLLLEEI